MATSQLVVVMMGSRFIAWMRAKQGKGQPIREDGIARHIVEKAGTPTMGGLMFLAGITVATLLWADLTDIYIWMMLLVTLAFGGLGFLDDYAKVTKQTTAGISGRFRLLVEALVAGLAVFLIVSLAAPSPEGARLSTSLIFPIFKNAVVNLAWFYLPFGAVVIVGASNAVNFTDGLDGLATVPVMIAAATFGVIAYMVGNFKFADYLELHYMPGVGESAVFCSAIVGSGLGFLWYNAPPARIFMGDSGSLALGGALGAVAVATKHEIVLAIVGGLFVVETVSVIIQVLWFKRTGRRVFLMAPIHHHFERLGWSEFDGGDPFLDHRHHARPAGPRHAEAEMIEVPGFEGRTVAVFGLARSGLAAARALQAGGARVAAWDENPKSRDAARAAGFEPVDLSTRRLERLRRPGARAGRAAHPSRAALDGEGRAGRRRSGDRRHRALRPGGERRAGASPAQGGGHHRHQRQIDHHRPHRPHAAPGRARRAHRRQHRRAGARPRADARRRDLCAGAVELSARPHP